MENKGLSRSRTEFYRVILIFGGIALNVLMAVLRLRYGIPFYLDCIGTIVVAGECGMLSGILTALISGIVSAPFNSMSSYFAIVNIVIAMCATYLFIKRVPRQRGGILLFILAMAGIGSVGNSFIEWSLLKNSEVPFVAALMEKISSLPGCEPFPSLIVANMVLHLADKAISVLSAFLIMFLIPRIVKEEIWKKDASYGENAVDFFDDPDGSKRRFLQNRLVVMLMLEVITLLAIAARVAVIVYTDNTTEERRAIAEGTIQMVAEVVNPEMVDEYIEKGDEADGFSEMERLLYVIRDNTPHVKFIYVYKILEDGYQVVIDLDAEDVPGDPPGLTIPFEDYMEPYIDLLHAGVPIETLESDSTYGRFYTEYMPLFNSQGECVAYAGVDVTMMDLQDYMNNFMLRISLISAGFLILVLALGIKLSENFYKVMDLQYQRVEKSKQEADRANTAKSRFLANMSHEIRTPINTIMGMNEMVLREDSDNVPPEYLGKIIEYSSNIKHASEHLLELINDVLDLSKVESGKMDLVEQEYTIKEHLQLIIDMIKLRSKEKDLYFDVDIDENLPCTLYGDSQKLKQVILNLLTNALKYTQKGGFMLKISVEERTADRCKVFVAVGDTGIGVKQEDIDKLFLPFDRLEEKRDSGIQGTGLGLSLSKQFVELMGSELKCDSIYGEGSTFYFTVEQRIVDPTPIGAFTDTPEIPEADPYIPQFVAPEGKVLAVDDNEMNLQVIKGLLKRTKLQLTTVMNGRDAVREIFEKRYDIVLLDHMMPGMDGIETLQEIRKIHSDLPVIALTANAANDGGTFYKQKGFQDYLAKPVDASKLESMIKRYLPPEIVQEPDMAEYERMQEAEELPENLKWLEEVEGIIVEEGQKNCGGLEAFMKSLQTFYDTLQENAQTIEDSWKQRNIDLYTIKVHALKSSARIIGAGALSELARKLEDAGKCEDIKYIDNNTDELLKVYRDYLVKLDGLRKPQSEEILKTAVSEEEIAAAFEALKEVVAQMDYDGTEMILGEMLRMELQEKDAKLLQEVEKALKKFDWDGIEELMN
ncbi:MAG: response regulator [Acetatifactor sp.]|nr:response regulator [Acetatifactor sp.]